MIAICADHAGFELKEYIIEHFMQNNIKYKDYGAYEYDADDNYPIIVEKLCQAIQCNECQRGIVICGNGIGVSIAANKFKGILAGLCGDTYTARTAREHGNINVLALGGRVVGKGLALDIVDIWMSTQFIEGKYKKRLDLVLEFEKR